MKYSGETIQRNKEDKNLEEKKKKIPKNNMYIYIYTDDTYLFQMCWLYVIENCTEKNFNGKS